MVTTAKTIRKDSNLVSLVLCLVSLVLCFAQLTNTATAATYYVDDTNGIDTSVGDSSHPWKTINRAVEGNSLDPNVVAGDTVYIRNGTYAAVTVNNVPSPEPASWTTDVITYQAAAGHHPKISSNVGNVSALTITGLYKRYLDFNDIDMEMAVQRAYPANSSVVYIERSGYIKIRNCSITGWWTEDTGGPPDDANAENSITSYGIWSRGYTSTKNNDLQFDNLDISQMQQGIATTEYFGTGFKVTNCKIHKVANSPIALNYNGNPNHGEILIQGNEFYDEEAKWQVSGDWSHGGIYCINNNGTYRGNIIHGCGASSGIFLPTNSDIRAGGGYHDILIENNLIYDTISILGLIRFYELGDGSIIIRNNTIIGSQSGTNGNIYDYYGGGTFTVNTLIEGATGAGFQFNNNIVVGCFSIPVGFTGFSAEGNIIYGTLDSNPVGSKYTWSGTNTIYKINADHTPPVNTHFITNFFANVDSQTYFRRGTDTVRYTNGGPHRTDYTTNFKLNSLSPAINYGVAAQQTSTDILGNARNASHHSAGCYEYYNHAPVLGTIGDKTVDENSLLTFTISATDADGDTITYSAQNLPTGATFVSPTHTFSWTPNYNQAGSYQVTFIASDGQENSETITITVNNVNRPPVLASIGNKSVNENSTLSFSINATDADGGTITYSAQNLPAGATFVGQTFSWTPDYTQAGSYPVTFIASDGQAQDSETITITVSIVGSTNRPPVLASIGNKLVHTDNLLVFNVNATDPDGGTITYSATGLPTGATFAGQSFRWTPGTSQAGTYYVTIIASDGLLQNSETITITVFYSTGDTSAPTVNGLSPAADSIQMPLDRLVILHVADNGEGVDANSVTIKVNDNIVYTGNTADYNSSYGRCHRTGAKADYTFIYQPHAAFDYDQKVSVVVNAQDLAGNAMSQYSYSFVTEARSFGENKMVNSISKNLSKGHPATVRDSAGNIWVAWHAGAVSSSGMRRGIYVGKLPAGADNFGISVREADNSSDRCNAALAIDAYDKLYLVWQDNRRNKWDIYMSTSVDGINWSTETRVTDSDNNAVNPVIAVDHSLPSKAYIAWQDDRADNQEIYIASSSDGFATETISRITSDSSDQIKPAIAVDSANTVYVVWADSRNGSSDIYGAASNNGPWANVPFVTKPGNQTNPAIATEATGTTLHLLWVDDTAGNKDIYYTASNGLPGTSLAGRNIVDDSSDADQLTPVIITTGSTGAGLRVFACWQDTRNIGKSGNTNLYSVEVNHGKETNIFVGNNATSSNKSAPVIGVDRYGYPYLVWADDRNQNTDIYYAGSTFVHSAALASQNVSPASDAIIGTEPANITGVDDVSVVVPAGAYPCELNITISKVENPPKLPVSLFNFSYGFGPSGANFSQPVTITIPYGVSASNDPAFAYWYNTLADALSQQGITNVETIAISPTLYAIRFKTTHFTQFFVGGSVSSSIQVAKCTIIAGSKDDSDKTSISGKIDATADNFTDAAVIEVTVDSNDMVNPCVLTFPIDSKTFKKGKYSYSGTERGVKKSFKYDVKTHSFAFAATNVNLSGLGHPLTFDINVGDYLGTAEINETIVNGKKPIPITLLMGVKYSLRIDTCQVKPGKKSNTDRLSVKGGFAVEDTDVDMANRVSEGLVVILGTQTFTISKDDLKAGKGKFTCSKAKVTEGGVATVSFDFNKGSFIMTISNANITASSGTVDFGVAFAGYSYSQIRQITLM